MCRQGDLGRVLLLSIDSDIMKVGGAVIRSHRIRCLGRNRLELSSKITLRLNLAKLVRIERIICRLCHFGRLKPGLRYVFPEPVWVEGALIVRWLSRFKRQLLLTSGWLIPRIRR